MRAFIQCNKLNEPFNPNVFNAYYGLNYLGVECIMFSTYSELNENGHQKEDLIVGGIEMIRRRLLDFGINVPMFDYPKELTDYLHRDIKRSTINRVASHPETWPLFVKSVEQKLMTGKVISTVGDLVGCGVQDNDFEVFVTKPVKFLSEFRVFVRYGEIIDVKFYKGDWSETYDSETISQAVKDFKTAPAAYGIDFGVTEDGTTTLIEVNDGFALGCYGMAFYNYAKFLTARWAELTDTEDPFKNLTCQI